jgi:hypothetical protein
MDDDAVRINSPQMPDIQVDGVISTKETILAKMDSILLCQKPIPKGKEWFLRE